MRNGEWYSLQEKFSCTEYIKNQQETYDRVCIEIKKLAMASFLISGYSTDMFILQKSKLCRFPFHVLYVQYGGHSLRSR